MMGEAWKSSKSLARGRNRQSSVGHLGADLHHLDTEGEPRGKWINVSVYERLQNISLLFHI